MHADSSALRKAKQLRARLLKAVSVLIVSLFTVPATPASATDFQAIERRLGEAVAKGEINLAQAQIMFSALRKSESVASDSDKKMMPEVQQRIAEIKSLDERGKLSPELAKEAIDGTRRRAGMKTNANERRQQVAEWYRQIEAAVKSGELSPADAQKKLEMIRAEYGDREMPIEELRGPLAIAKPKRAALEAKKKKLAATERSSGSSPGESKGRLEFAAKERELKKAVAEGKLSREEAAEKLKAAREEFRKN